MTGTNLKLYPLSHYAMASKPAQPEEDPSVNSRLARLQTDFEAYGMRRTVEGVLLVHEHGHPHILLLQVANAFFKLPGDYLQPGESDLAGLQSRLQLRLGTDKHSSSNKAAALATGSGAEDGGLASPPGATEAEVLAEQSELLKWEVGELLAQWWRPNFEGFMYPYIPGHITTPKEVRSMYLVQMPPKKVLAVPRNMKLLAVPLFELYDNAVRYGPTLSAVPHLLSKYNFEMVQA